MTDLDRLLPPASLTALVGAGGKTSLMYALAAAWAKAGRAVLCTTTTRLFPPETDQCHDVLLLEPDSNTAEIVQAVLSRITVGRVLLAALTPETGPQLPKLRGFSPELVDALARALPHACLLAEADGAARHPLKAPAEHEPAMPAAASRVLGVMGLDALAVPLDAAHIHRPERLCALLGVAPQTRLTCDHLARLAVHPDGLFKLTPLMAERWLLLNKADDACAHDNACRVAERVLELGFAGRVLITRALPFPALAARACEDTAQ